MRHLVFRIRLWLARWRNRVQCFCSGHAWKSGDLYHIDYDAASAAYGGDIEEIVYCRRCGRRK